MADLRQAFDESYYRLMGSGVSIADKGDSFFNRFYQKFTDASSEVKGKFANTDFAEQVNMRILLSIAFCLLMPDIAVAADSYTVPRTEHGQPDLQGIWTNATITPLQRPRNLGDQRAYTAEEAMGLEATATQSEYEKTLPLDAERTAPEAGSRVGQNADFDFYGSYTNLANYGGEYRTSLIVKPADGRWPHVENYTALDHWGQQRTRGLDPFDGPEGRPSGERCLDRGLLLSLARIVPYNANYQIVQNRDYVLIHAEVGHDSRIIKLSGDYFPGDFNHWHGDSVGHWEGDTLVVESRNFRPEQSSGFVRMTDNITVVERFTRVTENAIEYSYELTDPTIYTETVRVEMPLKQIPAEDHMYEYACHEGNYSLSSILAGARRAEADAVDP